MATIDDIISDLQQSILEIKKDIGVSPGNPYANTRIRLDILESRINNPLSPSPTVENPFYIGNSGVTISTGIGVPTENRLDGSIFLRQDSQQSIYYTKDGYWFPLSDGGGGGGGINLNGDLSGDSNFQTVVGIQNRNISSNAPYDGQILTWTNSLNAWAPLDSPIFFDLNYSGYISNLKANRIDAPSYTDGSKKGILNLASFSSASADYVTITGGIQNQSNYQYSLISSGANNTINAVNTPLNSDGYVTIINGANNLINKAKYHSTIINGLQNYISASASTIVGGGLNTISNGTLHFIGSGYGNSITNYELASIVSGYGNTIEADYGLINQGYYNQVKSRQSTVINGTYNYILTTSENCSILNGYSNIISDDYDIDLQYSNILNGVQNIIAGTKSTIVNGQYNTINSSNCTILNGFSNQILNNSNDSLILNGNGNSIVSPNVKIFGNGNLIINNASFSSITGQSNVIDGYISGNNSIKGSFNNVFGDFCTVHGENNTVGSTLNYLKHVNVIGYRAKANYSGQYVQSSHHIDGVIGGAQYSRIILEGAGALGQQFYLTNFQNDLIFEDNKCYEISLRVLITNTTLPIICARFVIDILASQQYGVLNLMNINNTISTLNSTSWSVDINTDSANKLLVSIPSNGSDNRKAIATIEWREISVI